MCLNIVLPQWMRIPQTHYIHNPSELCELEQVYHVHFYPKHHLMTPNWLFCFKGVTKKNMHIKKYAVESKVLPFCNLIEMFSL